MLDTKNVRLEAAEASRDVSLRCTDGRDGSCPSSRGCGFTRRNAPEKFGFLGAESPGMLPRMTGKKKHLGGCHCGAVRYEVELDVAEPAITCNCSICSKTGTMLNFVPLESFRLLSGEEKLTDYQFNKMVIHHLFCNVCGVRSFARGIGPDGKEMRAINVRCLDDIDLERVPTQQWNGKAT